MTAMKSYSEILPSLDEALKESGSEIIMECLEAMSAEKFLMILAPNNIGFFVRTGV